MIKLRTQKKWLNNKGVGSFVEIIISAVIFMIAATGTLSILTTTSPQSLTATRRLQQVQYGRSIMEKLRGHTIDWNDPTSLIAVGVNRTETEGDYTATWWLEDVPGLELRQLHLTVDYTGP